MEKDIGESVHRAEGRPEVVGDRVSKAFELLEGACEIACPVIHPPLKLRVHEPDFPFHLPLEPRKFQIRLHACDEFSPPSGAGALLAGVSSSGACDRIRHPVREREVMGLPALFWATRIQDEEPAPDAGVQPRTSIGTQLQSVFGSNADERRQQRDLPDDLQLIVSRRIPQHPGQPSMGVRIG
jgi:hypothetical protein